MNRPLPAQELALDQLVAGMTLAQPLLDAHGAVLLPQDALLTEATLAALRRRGITHCTVRAGSTAATPAQLAQAQAQRLKRLDYVFRHAAGDGGAWLWQRLRDYRTREPA